MKKSIFLSHNANDKPFVRKLGLDLESHGIKVWIDEAEIKIGDSLIEKISDGLSEVDYLAVILSPNSVKSRWVQEEINIAMYRQISNKTIKILPILYQQCERPIFLEGRKYCDFLDADKYQESLQELIKDIGVVFNKTILDTYGQEPNLGNAADVAIANNLPIFSMPFYRPFQYIGMPIADIIKQLNIAANEDNNIVIETDECRMLMESEGILIDYINIDIKKTSPCCQAKEFNSIPVLGSLSINPSELELIRKQTHCHAYYDHRRKLKISILCLADGSPLSVSFSAKYYGD